MKLPDPPLLIITDRCRAKRPIEDVAAAAFAGGCRWLSLREKDLAPEERLALLRRLVEIGRRWGACVGVHEDVAAAQAAVADAVHLPDGASPADARTRLGAGAVIGLSLHDADGVAATIRAGADYVTLSPIFLTASKPGYGPAVGLALLAKAAAASPLPILALGGVTPERTGACVAAGAAGVAVMGDIMAAADPAQAAAAHISSLRAALAAREGCHA